METNKEKIHPKITIELSLDDEGNIKGAQVNVSGLSFFEAIAALEIAKLNIINSQTQKESWTKIFK